MLTRVVVQSENPFYLQIRDARPTDSIILEKIEGLGPPDIDLFLGDYARDGGFYSGRRVPTRNVILTLKINPNYKINESVSGLRTLLYKTFMDPFPTSDSLSLTLEDDELPDRYVSGNVDKFGVEVFDEDTVVTISMLCPNPYILDSANTFLPGSGPQLTFDYDGSAETGFDLAAVISADTSHLTLDLNGQIMKIDYDFHISDVVRVMTVRGSRLVTVTRSSVTTSLLYAIVSSTTWLEIHAPSNVLKLYGALTTDIIANITSLDFTASHWGV